MKNYKELISENRAWAEETFKKIDAKMSAMTLRSRSKLPDGVAAYDEGDKSMIKQSIVEFISIKN